MLTISPSATAQGSNHPGVLTTKPSEVLQKAWDYYTELVAAGDQNATSESVKWVCFVDTGYYEGPVTSTTFFLVSFSKFYFSVSANRDGVYADNIPVTTLAFFTKDPKGKSVNTEDSSTYLFNHAGAPPAEDITVVVDRFPFSFQVTKSYTTEGNVRANLSLEEEVTGRYNIHIVVPPKEESKSSTPFDVNITGRCYAPAWNGENTK
jgi:hypothetical protein